MSVEVTFQEADFFKKIIDSLKGLVDEVTFECSIEGMTLQAMDVSHISLVAINLPADSFQSYSCSEPTKLSFNIDTLAKIFKSISPKDTLTIKSDPDTSIELHLNSPNDDKSTVFRLQLIDTQYEPVSIPDHIYGAKLTINSNALNQLIRSLSDLDDSTTVRCTEGQIRFISNDSAVEATTTFIMGITPDKLEDEVDVDVTEDCKVSYALRYLKAFSAASSLSTRVTLSFSPHYPLLVEYPLGTGGYVRFYLSPKIEEDEDDKE